MHLEPPTASAHPLGSPESLTLTLMSTKTETLNIGHLNLPSTVELESDQLDMAHRAAFL